MLDFKKKTEKIKMKRLTVNAIILRVSKRVKYYYSIPCIINHRICHNCCFIKPLHCFYTHRNKISSRCKSCLTAYQRSLNKRSPEKRRAYQAKRYANDPQKYINRTLAHAKANPGQYRRRAADRHSLVLNRTPKWLNELQKQAIKEIYNKAAYLSKKYNFKYELDHIVPLRGKNVSGLHVPWNLRIVSKSENASKSNKFSVA